MPKWLVRHAWLAILAVALMAVFAFGACGDDEKKDGGAGPTDDVSEEPVFGDYGGVVVEPGQSIQIGITAVLAGDLRALGTTVRDAVALAAEDFGPVKAFPVEILPVDDGCSADPGLAAAEILLAEDNLVAVIGSICSGVNVAVQPRYAEENITQVSSGSTAVRVTYPEGRDPFDTFVRTVVHDGVQGVEQAKYAYEALGAKTVYSAHDTDAYGAGLKDVFNKNFEELGGQILGTQGWEKKQTDFGALVTAVTTAGPDLVYVASFDPEAAAFIRQLKAAGYAGKFLAGDGVITKQFLDLAGADAEGAFLSKPAPFDETPELIKFKEDYKTRFGSPWDDQPYAPESYDAYRAVHEALNEVAVVFGGKLYIDLADLNDAIRGADFDGISGHVAFDDHGDKAPQLGKPLILFYEVKSGAYEQLVTE